MKRGQIFEGVIVDSEFPNKSKVKAYEEKEDVKTSFFSLVKGGIEGQKIRFRIKRSRKENCTGILLETLEKSPLETASSYCPKFGTCGGCAFQTVPYEKQLKLKEKWIKKLFENIITKEKNHGKDFDEVYEKIYESPNSHAYRNKMEFSFGDEKKDGPLTLGLHKKNSFYDVIDASGCNIVNDNFSVALDLVKTYVVSENISLYNKKNHIGTLRHLLIRYSETYDEILIAIVTSSQGNYDFKDLADLLKQAEEGVVYNGEKFKFSCKVRGVINVINDSLSDAVKCDKLIKLYGDDYLMESLLGKEFKLSLFSFFQTNTLGAEILYSKVREYLGDEIRNKTVFDLFSGTGTISQIIAPVAGKVVGVEIVEDAVKAARENAKLNVIDNCEFIAGDVFEVLDSLKTKPDVIILDPPREGLMPKTLEKVLKYGVNNIVYVSCKPTSLSRDLEAFFENGYKVEKMCNVDMFPMTGHVETVVSLVNKFAKAKDFVQIGIDAEKTC